MVVNIQFSFSSMNRPQSMKGKYLFIYIYYKGITQKCSTSFKFRDFLQRNADLTAILQQKSLQRAVSQPEFKASFVNTASAQDFPFSPSQSVRTFHLRFLPQAACIQKQISLRQDLAGRSNVLFLAESCFLIVSCAYSLKKIQAN